MNTQKHFRRTSNLMNFECTLTDSSEKDAAGQLRSGHKTSDPAERLLADSAILSLAKAVLPREEYDESEKLAEMLAGTETSRNLARTKLIHMVRPPPKRPLYYCQHEVEFLPRWTRDALRYLGDFVDAMVKHAVYGEEQKAAIFQKSLGPAIDAFAKCFPNESTLVGWLRDYNKFLYRDAKHDMKLPANRTEHRFTSREVVLCLFITMKLADLITVLSPAAADYRTDGHP